MRDCRSFSSWFAIETGPCSRPGRYPGSALSFWLAPGGAAARVQSWGQLKTICHPEVVCQS